MKKIAAVALSCLVLAALAAPAPAGAVKVVTRNVLLQTTSGFSTGSFAGGTIFGGTGEMRQGGAAIGSFSSVCIAASAVRGQCNVTLIWKGRGRVQIAGSIRVDRDPNILLIVGGTGEFRGLRGTAEVERASVDGSRQRARLRFLR